MITASKNSSDAGAAGNPVPAPARILVVDDEATMQILACTILQKLGHEAETVSSGEEDVATD